MKTSLMILMLSLAAIPALAGVGPGDIAPDFTLMDLENNPHTLSEYLDAGHPVVLEWFNPDCPFVKKHHLDNHTMLETYALAAEHGVVWLAINSAAPGKQGHGKRENKVARDKYKIEYPVLLDEDGKIGHLYGAKTTPHMFVIGNDGTIAYAGAIDDNRSPYDLGEINYVVAALRSLLKGEALKVPETQPYGCSVKYAD